MLVLIVLIVAALAAAVCITLYVRQSGKRRMDEKNGETLRMILDHIGQALIVVDRELNVVLYNQQFCDYFDLKPGLQLRADELVEKWADAWAGSPENRIEALEHLRSQAPFTAEMPLLYGRVLEFRHNPMPDGGFIRTFTDITERKRMEEELERLATTDYLTGLRNRRIFMEHGNQEIARARRYGCVASLILFDADRFKPINDEHGHDAGDRVIRGIARILQRELRVNDIPARLGGEEFGIILPLTDLREAIISAERLRDAIADYEIRLDDGAVVKLTASFGVAEIRSQDNEILEVMKRADAALYEAKNQGRNRVVHAE